MTARIIPANQNLDPARDAGADDEPFVGLAVEPGDVEPGDVEPGDVEPGAEVVAGASMAVLVVALGTLPAVVYATDVYSAGTVVSPVEAVTVAATSDGPRMVVVVLSL